MMDEHPDSINDGMMINEVAASSWLDIPGGLHEGATSVSFADGHVDTRRWRSKTSKLPVRFQYVQPPNFDAEGRRDHAWYIENSGLVRY
jgi:prepilin-type processing-associated H-X9-DG protein